MVQGAKCLADKISTAAGPIAARKLLPSARLTMDALLFSAHPRHAMRPQPSFQSAFGIISAGVEGICDMRQVSSFLRSSAFRIGRRAAAIVAIAAASLPAAGA
jgi:hypothetical protein